MAGRKMAVLVLSEAERSELMLLSARRRPWRREGGLFLNAGGAWRIGKLRRTCALPKERRQVVPPLC